MTMPADPELEPAPVRRPPPARELARDLGGRLRSMSTSRPFLAYMIAVAVLAGLYFFLIAAPVYVSNTSFSIRGRTKAPATPSIMGAISGGGGATADPSETAEVADYIRSPEMLAALDKRLGLRTMYKTFRVDPFAHMWGDSEEDFLNFYRKRVIARIDRESFITRVEVRSFDAKSAHAIAENVLALTAEYVNNLSAKIRAESLRSAEGELNKAASDVRQARLNVTRYRTATGVVDPAASAMATSGSINSLHAQMMAAQAERAALATYSAPNAPMMQQSAAKIAALQNQIAAEQRRLASNSQPNTNLAQRVNEYEGLAVDKEYAEQRLVAALAAYDSARTTASQRERFVVRVVNPNYPDRPTLPRRFLNFLETLAAAAAAYAIIALAIAGVRDHQGI